MPQAAAALGIKEETARLLRSPKRKSAQPATLEAIERYLKGRPIANATPADATFEAGALWAVSVLGRAIEQVGSDATRGREPPSISSSSF